jgi:hypothetical protein
MPAVMDLHSTVQWVKTRKKRSNSIPMRNKAGKKKTMERNNGKDYSMFRYPNKSVQCGQNGYHGFFFTWRELPGSEGGSSPSIMRHNRRGEKLLPTK